MRNWERMVWLAGVVLLGLVVSSVPARADEAAAAEAPKDPTRGQWDSFLDPLRDFEDNYVVATQKKIEDKTKIHLAAGISESWNWDFNTPPNGSALPYDNFLTQNSGSVEIGQIRANRPSEGWF